MAAITAITLTPTPATAGVSSSHLINFTTATSLPANGKILVTYPAGFDASAAVATSSTINGGFTVAVVGQVVTITRNNLGTSTTAGARDITLAGVVNSPTVGAYTVTVETRTSLDANIDGPNTSGSFSLTGSALTNVIVVPTPATTSAVAIHRVGFKTTSTIPLDGKVVIVYPAGFDVSNARVVSTSLDGSLAISVSAQTITLTRSGGTASVGGRVIDLGGIINNATIGSYTLTSLTTKDSSNATIDGPTASASFALTGGGLSNATLGVSTVGVEMAADYTLSFAIASTLPANGKIVVVFPSGVNVASASVKTSNLTGAFSTSVSGQTVTVTRDNSGSATVPSTVTLTLTGIVNPTTPNSYALVSIVTQTTAAAEIDRATVLPAVTVTGFHTSTVRILGKAQYEIVKTDFMFDPSRVVVTNLSGFPNRFKISSGPDADHLAGSTKVTLTGTVTVTKASAAVVGAGTSFLTKLAVGDIVQLLDGLVLGVVKSITDDTHFTLVDVWAGVNGAGVTLFVATPVANSIAVLERKVFAAPIGGIFSRLFTKIEALDGPLQYSLETPSGTLTVVRDSVTEKSL